MISSCIQHCWMSLAASQTEGCALSGLQQLLPPPPISLFHIFKSIFISHIYLPKSATHDLGKEEEWGCKGNSWAFSSEGFTSKKWHASSFSSYGLCAPGLHNVPSGPSKASGRTPGLREAHTEVQGKSYPELSQYLPLPVHPVWCSICPGLLSLKVAVLLTAVFKQAGLVWVHVHMHVHLFSQSHSQCMMGRSVLGLVWNLRDEWSCQVNSGWDQWKS